MSVTAPSVALAFGSVAPPQGDIVDLQLHLGCTSEVSSFEAVLANFDGKYSPSGAYPITVGLDGSISIGRGANCPQLMTCHVETVKYESTPSESYVHVAGRCWGERLFRRVITKTYANAKAETLVKELMDYYVGLSHVRGATELVEDTDTTYTSLAYQDTPVFDVLKYIAESADTSGVIGYDFRVAPDGKFEFFPKGTKPSSFSLIDRIEQSTYTQDISRVRNKATVYGAAEKSVPIDQDAWTESLTPTDGWWSATSGTIALDTGQKVKGSGSIQTSATNLSYAASIFSLESSALVDAESYPTLNLWLYLEEAFNGNVSLTLYDGDGRAASHQFTVGTGTWQQKQLSVGGSAEAQWQVAVGFDWTRIWRILIACWFPTMDTGSFWVDGLFFGGKRFSATAQNATSQANYGLREQVEVNEELYSDAECTGRAQATLANLQSPAETLTLVSTVLDYGATPILAGDTVHITLPTEGLDADFRVTSAEYHVDAATQTLETKLTLGREPPLMADYVYALRSKTDSLSRYKAARR